MGIGVGTALGVSMDNLPVGLLFGIAMGAGIGTALMAAMSKKAEPKKPDVGGS